MRVSSTLSNLAPLASRVLAQVATVVGRRNSIPAVVGNACCVVSKTQ